jgi:hypothetical protein
MNSAANTAETMPANDTAQPARAKRARKASAPIAVDVIKSRDWTRFGHKHEGRVSEGHHAVIVPGESILLHGIETSHDYVDGKVTKRSRLFAQSFKLGDRAVYHTYNLIFTGPIVAIGAETVTIAEDDHEGRNHRLSLYDFDRLNHDYDPEYIFKNNTEWRD